MKKINILSLSLLVFLSTSSCNHSENHEHGDEHATHQEHGDKHAEAIELNAGEKWTVNAEMTPFVVESEKLLNDYDNSDYKLLAQNLKENNTKLIKSCTMDGKSHDELHKWLAPHLDLVKALGKAENEDEANGIIADLGKSFETYHTYFQ